MLPEKDYCKASVNYHSIFKYLHFRPFFQQHGFSLFMWRVCLLVTCEWRRLCGAPVLAHPVYSGWPPGCCPSHRACRAQWCRSGCGTFPLADGETWCRKLLLHKPSLEQCPGSLPPAGQIENHIRHWLGKDKNLKTTIF